MSILLVPKDVLASLKQPVYNHLQTNKVNSFYEIGGPGGIPANNLSSSYSLSPHYQVACVRLGLAGKNGLRLAKTN